MKKYFCDRCEKEIKNHIYYIYIPAMPSWANRAIDYQHITDRMLCKDCLLSFANWVGSDFLYNEYSRIKED